MSNLCEKLLDACIGANCENPLFQGVDSIGYIANYSDIAEITYDETNPSIVNGITMKTIDETGTDPISACFYTIQQLGNNPFNGSQIEMTEGTYMNRFTNTVNFAVLDNSPEVSEHIIDNLANGRFVVILKNDYTGTDGSAKYQIFGAKKGLKAASITRELYGDAESAWVVSMTEENAPKSGLFVWKTNEATTDDLVDNLLCECDE